MKPVDHMFTVRMQILPYLPHVFAPIGQEHHLLIFLHPLGLHHFPESPAWLRVVRLHETEAFGRWDGALIRRVETPQHSSRRSPRNSLACGPPARTHHQSPPS